MTSYKYYIERYWPIAGSIVCTCCFVLYVGATHPSVIHFSNVFEPLNNAMLNVSGALFGFFLTVLTIITAIDNRRMRFIKSGGAFPRVLEYLKGVISVQGFVIVLSLLYIGIHTTRFFFEISLGFFMLETFILSLAIFKSIRFGKIFYLLVSDDK